MPTLFITGANRGLGLELCKEYIKLGWQVHATCRDPSSALELKAIQSAHKDLLTVHALDVSNDQQISELKNELNNIPIDILFNNAGIYAAKSGEFGQSDRDCWLESFNINVISALKIMEAFVDNVIASDKKIMANMSSKMGSISDNTSGGSYAYRSSKTALNTVVVSASQDLKAKGITVLALHPGWVRTDMGGPNGELSVAESAAGLLKNLNNATIEDTGKFYDIDGSIIAW